MTSARIASPILSQSKEHSRYPPALTGRMRLASWIRRVIINLVMTCGCPAPPSVKTTNQDSEPIMPSVPHGVTDSGSSAMSVVTIPVNPPSTALNAAKNTNTAATNHDRALDQVGVDRRQDAGR